MNTQPVVLVASGGGHLEQLRRIAAGVAAQVDAPFVLVTTGDPAGLADTATEAVAVTDFSRETAWRALRCYAEVRAVLVRTRPRAVVTTGAAPGLVAVLAARLRGIPALWIDSLANPRRLSLSARLARRCGARVISQWPEVAAEAGVAYRGRLL